MPSSWVIGILAGLGMWTFFIIIGIIAFAMGEAFAQSGMIHIIAIGIAVLLIILGSIMLLGITSHVLGFVQKLVDRWSTTEMDETFTPRRNMYLYGIGHGFASIDVLLLQCCRLSSSLGRLEPMQPILDWQD